MTKKREKNILIGIGSVNLINGTLLTLSPAIFKSINFGSEWFIGVYLTLNTLLTFFGSSIVSFNRFALKLNYNLITYLNLIVPGLLIFMSVFFNNVLFLYLYIVIFSILSIIRHIGVSAITMLDRNNIDLIHELT